MSAARGTVASTGAVSRSEKSSVWRASIATTHTCVGTLKPISLATFSAFCNEVSCAEVVCPAE